MSRTWIENTLQWLNKKAQMKALEKQKTLRKKFQKLNEEKKQFEKELYDFMMENKNTNLNVNKKWYITIAARNYHKNKLNFQHCD